ncbi:GH1 family beta-glucosidase [Phycisphaeraceae bacterium D3-23]
MSFPQEFVWGAAAASFQIEGTSKSCPRGDSVWDAFCDTPGKVFEGHNGRRACMHIEKWREDVELMSELGLDAYRLSIAWPRIMPDGTGDVNEAGLDFYSDLVNELIAAGITPYVTLYHWDLPLKLQQQGGWLNPSIVAWFAEYTRVVVERLSDRVKHWITLNEPQCFVLLGNQTGVHAPGLQLPEADVLRIGHHALLAHGRAVQTIREVSDQPAQIGIAPIGVVSIPETERQVDIDAARKATFENAGDSLFSTTWWLDPVFKGRYPECGVHPRLKDMPPIAPGDMALINQPIDFCAFNLYQAGVVRAGADGEVEPVPYRAGYPVTAMDWPVTPAGIYWASRFLYERYESPLYITENGLSCRDWVSIDGKVHDPNRIDFLTRYLGYIGRACDEGIPVEGFFQWSIMDNFEWAEGYKDRFGMVYVDFDTLERIPKDSYHWYQGVIANNGGDIPAWQQCNFDSAQIATPTANPRQKLASMRETNRRSNRRVPKN